MTPEMTFNEMIKFLDNPECFNGGFRYRHNGETKRISVLQAIVLSRVSSSTFDSGIIGRIAESVQEFNLPPMYQCIKPSTVQDALRDLSGIGLLDMSGDTLRVKDTARDLRYTYAEGDF